MPATPSSAARPARRVARRGSVLGLGLLVAGGTAAAPAALADDGTPAGGVPPTVPDQDAQLAGAPINPVPAPVAEPRFVGDFGLGKASPSFSLGIDPQGVVPGDLDLSGGVFTLTAEQSVVPAGLLDVDGSTGPAAAPPSFTCTTDVTGLCVVTVGPPGASTAGTVSVPAGGYRIQQTGAVPGLTPPSAGDYWTLTLCDDHTEDWITNAFCYYPSRADSGTVPNSSQFTTEIDTTVVDGSTGEPLAGATYRLSGPDYRHAPGAEYTDDCQPVATPVDEEPLDPQIPVREVVPQDGDETSGTGNDAADGATDTSGSTGTDTDGTGGSDAGASDPGSSDTQASDTGASDTGASDTGASDTWASDTGSSDTGGSDGGATDTGTDGDVTTTTTASGNAALAGAVERTDPEDPAVATSDGTGVLRHLGCFLPGTWSLDTVTTPQGYQPKADTVVLDVPVWDDEAEDWDRVAENEVALSPLGSTPTTTTTPASPTVVPPVTTGGDPLPTGSGTGGGSTGGDSSGGSTGGSGTRGSAARPAGGTATTGAAVPTEASPTAAAPTVARPTPGTATARPAAAGDAAADPAPPLQTESSTNYLEVGLVGFGVLFVALVFFLVLWMRRRARDARG